jgi:hypothetical protein
MQTEAGVAAAAIALVRHIDQAERGDRDAHRRDPSRRHGLADQHRNSASGDAQDRDLVAAGVDRQQVLSVRSYLDRALGGEARAQARAPALIGEPASGVSEPSACRANPSMVLAGAVLPST